MWSCCMPQSAFLCVVMLQATVCVPVCGHAAGHSQCACMWSCYRPQLVCLCVVVLEATVSIPVCGHTVGHSQRSCVWSHAAGHSHLHCSVTENRNNCLKCFSCCLPVTVTLCGLVHCGTCRWYLETMTVLLVIHRWILLTIMISYCQAALSETESGWVKR